VEVGADSGSYLADATREALRLVEGDEDGFVLMVEGSLIDGMGHGNNAPAQQVEMRGFMSAVEVAVEYADSHPGTLVVVTSDHETGGLSIVSSDANFNLAEQGIEYRWSTGGHSATMVPIYLYGTGAESINGVMENAELGAKLKSLIGD
jgi:alkaline phosphatase